MERFLGWVGGTHTMNHNRQTTIGTAQTGPQTGPPTILAGMCAAPPEIGCPVSFLSPEIGCPLCPFAFSLFPFALSLPFAKPVYPGAFDDPFAPRCPLPLPFAITVRFAPHRTGANAQRLMNDEPAILADEPWSTPTQCTTLDARIRMLPLMVVALPSEEQCGLTTFSAPAPPDRR